MIGYFVLDRAPLEVVMHRSGSFCDHVPFQTHTLAGRAYTYPAARTSSLIRSARGGVPEALETGTYA